MCASTAGSSPPGTRAQFAACWRVRCWSVLLLYEHNNGNFIQIQSPQFSYNFKDRIE